MEARAPAMADLHPTTGEESPPTPGGDRPTRADALRRIAAEVSGRHDLDGLFRDVIDEAFTLFGVDQAGLWMYDDSPTPLRAVAQRGLARPIRASAKSRWLSAAPAVTTALDCTMMRDSSSRTRG